MARAKSKRTPKAAATPKPLVTADTITTAQIRFLDKEARAAGDDAMRDECKVALDPAASTRKRQSARQCCAELWNALQTMTR